MNKNHNQSKCTGCFCAKTYGGRCSYHPKEIYIAPTTDRGLYEILVPTVRNDGRPIHTRFHRVWDQKVRDIAGGLTIMHPAKGQWIEPSVGELYTERMIPVRIACSREQIDKIIKMTLTYYSQKAIMAYKLSDEVIIYHENS